MQFDLVLLSLGGVQRFIGESRSTADVAGASGIVQELAKLGARAVHERLASSPAPCGLIFPATADAPSVTNKIAFLAAEGTGPKEWGVQGQDQDGAALGSTQLVRMSAVWRTRLRKQSRPPTRI